MAMSYTLALSLAAMAHCVSSFTSRIFPNSFYLTISTQRPVIHHHHFSSTKFSALFISSSPAEQLQEKRYTRSTEYRQFSMRNPTLLRMGTSTSSSTSSSPDNSKSNDDGCGGINISIEYCSACRWMLRSSWIASELLTTFAYEEESQLTSVTMIPQSPPLNDGGIFRILAESNNGVSNGDNDDVIKVLWDRKVTGRFPEAKEVKQLVRDCVNPGKNLGHSDKDKDQASDVIINKAEAKKKEEDCVECKEERIKEQGGQQKSAVVEKDDANIPSIFYEHNSISIEYSVGASIESPDNILHQATYYANEMLSMMYERNAWWKKSQQEEKNALDDATQAAVDRVTLIPNRKDSGILVSIVQET